MTPVSRLAMASPRIIPSVDRLLERPELADAIAREGRQRVTDALRRAAADLRGRLSGPEAVGTDADAAAAWIAQSALEEIDAARRPSLRRVINATGVIVHTNLGRAPLTPGAVSRIAEIATGYSNLEYDLDAGERGHRHVHAERRLREITGAEAALVVNNNAAAALLALAALAAGREVVVSRGELVEIGGGFRVPDVLAQSGAILREVGTTNRTRAADYAAAIHDRTALLLRVHPSNFAMTGFTERPSLAELASLARRFDVPLMDDLGSGWVDLGGESPAALADEPTVSGAIGAGADIVTFSGDKLLGGPQAGIIAGRAALLERIRRHPLLRAVRAGKLTYAALDATLDLWMRPPARSEIPVYRMLTLDAATIGARAEAVVRQIAKRAGLRATVVDGSSAIGGGAAPASSLPTRVIALVVDGRSAATLLTDLRRGDPPIVARIEDDRVVLDLRTVAEHEDAVVTARLLALGS